MRCLECKEEMALSDHGWQVLDRDDCACLICTPCDATYPPQLRPSLGFVPALMRSINAGETSPPEV